MTDNRTEKAKEDVFANLSDREKEMILSRRALQELTEGTHAYRLAIEVDRDLINFYKSLSDLGKAVHLVEDGKNSIDKKKVEMLGEIKSKLNGELMTKDELNLEINLRQSSMEDALISVRKYLFAIRSFLHAKDLYGNVVMGEEEFESLAAETEIRLGKAGITLYTRS